MIFMHVIIFVLMMGRTAFIDEMKTEINFKSQQESYAGAS